MFNLFAFAFAVGLCPQKNPLQVVAEKHLATPPQQLVEKIQRNNPNLTEVRVISLAFGRRQSCREILALESKTWESNQ